ncbi:hypothetical protein FRC01_012965, partial [Tulasnella sp. 417]
MPPKKFHEQHHHRPTLDEDPLPLPPNAPPHTYNPQPSRAFTENEVTQGLHRLNQKIRLNHIAHHPANAIVEYPETTDLLESRIAHVFMIDPDAFRNPLRNVQYSLDNCGQDNNVKCRLLIDETCDDPQGRTFTSDVAHTFITPSRILPSHSPAEPPVAHKEVFEKTFGLFCSIMLEGCSAQPLNVEQDSESDTDDEGSQTGLAEATIGGSPELAIASNKEKDATPVEERPNADDCDSQLAVDDVRDPRSDLRPTRSKRKLGCRGQIIAQKDKTTGKTFLRCKFWKPFSENQNHFLLRSLHEHDFEYLCALIENNGAVIEEKEKAARKLGYGPLVPCTHTAEVRQVSEKCLFWHRSKADGSLAPGCMIRPKPTCMSKLDTFIPLDLHRFPYVVIVTSGAHNHPPPHPTKTPIIFVDFLRSLILEEGWKIADATPRRLITDGAFVARLRHILGWTATANPSLADLHPSLANLDHVSWLIKEIQRIHFPDGTDWAGAQRLYRNQLDSVDPSGHYIRHIEERSFHGTAKPFRLI